MTLSKESAKAYEAYIETLRYGAFQCELCPDLSSSGSANLRSAGLHGVEDLSPADQRALSASLFASWSASPLDASSGAFDEALRLVKWFLPLSYYKTSAGEVKLRDADPTNDLKHFYELAGVRAWPEHRVDGVFFVLSESADGAVCIEQGDAAAKVYVVKGSSAPLSEVIGGSLPASDVRLSFLPFHGTLVFDCLPDCSAASFLPPPSLVSSMSSTYDAAVSRGEVLSSFPAFEESFSANKSFDFHSVPDRKMVPKPAPAAESKPARRCENCRNKDVKLSACSTCRKVSYCSVLCQREHWKLHRTICKGLSS